MASPTPKEFTSEAQVLAYARASLSKIGVVLRVTSSGTRGVSDLIACVRGKFVACECKSPLGSTTPMQEKFVESVKASGGWTFVVRSRHEVDDMVLELMLVFWPS